MIRATPPQPERTQGIVALLNVRQTARMLSIGERTLWSETAPRGNLPCVVIGKKGVRYRPQDIEAYIARKTVRPTGDAEPSQN